MISVLNQTLQALMPFLIRQLYYSSILFLFIYAVILVFRIHSPRWQTGLWIMVFLRLILPPDFHFNYSGRSLLEGIPVFRQFTDNIHSLFGRKQTVQAGNLFKDGFSLDDGGGFEHHGSGNLENSLSRYSWILFLLWCLGTGFIMVHFLRLQARYNEIVHRARPVRSPHILKMCVDWKKRFGIRRYIRIVTSNTALSPFTADVMHPVIYLPRSVLDLEDLNLLESVIAHEMAHIYRLDHLWAKLQTAIQICYFFHPVVWITGSRLNIARECLCDELVLSQNKLSASTYGQGILDILKLNLMGAHKKGLLLCFGSPAKKMNYRLQQILNGGVMKKYQKIILYSFIVGFGMLLLPMAAERNFSAGLQAVAFEPRISTAEITFRCPMEEGRLTARFGPMVDPFNGKERQHRGVDIAAPKGTEIYATADGVVTVSFSDPDKDEPMGYHVQLDHGNGYSTRYTHMDEVKVKKDEKVKKGQVIGTVGNSGRSTGPHLHFEVIQNGEYVNPEDFLDFSGLKWTGMEK